MLLLFAALFAAAADHPWQLSPGLNFFYKVYVPDSKPVVHFRLSDFAWLVTIL